MFIKDNALKSCKYIENSLCFDYKNRVRLCPYYEEAVVAENLDGIWLNIKEIEEKRNNLILNPPDKCLNCKFSTQENKKNNGQIDTLFISNWHFCYVNCVYCKYPKEEDLLKAKHYDIFPFFKELENKELITKKTKIIFECGDACVHPEFDKIMFYLINSDFKDVEVNTSAQRFCESIAQGIAKNMTKVIISFDSGCQYIYHRVKQINKFNIAVNNIKKYLAYQLSSQKNVILKYNIIQGINDNKKEPVDLLIYARDMGINKLIFDIEADFYERSLNHVPQHIKDIMIFIKKMEKCNDFEIEFAPRLNILYKLII